MGKGFKRVFLAVFLIMIIACFGTEKSSLHQIRAEESNTLQGTYGDNLKWEFEDGLLIISGTGVIPKSFISNLISYESPGFKKHQIQEIRIEQGITEVGELAFDYCSNLKKVQLPQGLKKIDGNAFSSGAKLEEINLPDGLESIGTWAFCDEEVLKNIEIPESVSEIGEGAFYQCVKLESIKLPKKIKHVSDYLFGECTSLKSVELPETVADIGEGAFSACRELEEIHIPEAVTDIGEGAFSNCKGLKQISWPKNINKINDSMFSGCTFLTHIDFPEDLKSIGEYAFSDCRKLEEMKVPETVSSIGEGAFSDCIKLKDIDLPDRMTSINDYLFSGCKALEEFQFPKSVTQIGEAAFESCTGLKYIEIPDTVTQIGEDAFSECEKLEYIRLSKNIKVLHDNTFEKCRKLTSLEIPEGVITLGQNIVFACNNLKLIMIPKSVVNIRRNSIEESVKQATIIGESGSNIESYAKKYNKKFLSKDQWKCNHYYEHQILKSATLKKDGLRISRCFNCGYTILGKLSHPVSISAERATLLYNGGQQIPLAKVKLANGKILGSEFYEYEDYVGNRNVGSYKTRIHLKDGYEGTLEYSYKIVKATREITCSDKNELIGSYDRTFSLGIYANGHDPKIIYKISDPKILSIDAKGMVHAKRIGSCTVTAYAEGNGNYLKSNQVKVKVRIIPAKINIKTAKAKSRGKISLKWAKDSKVDGYEIQYTTKKNELNSRIIRIKNTKTTSITLKNLRRNKKYYISIRGYKKVKSGKRYREVISSPTKKIIKTK